MPKIDCQRPAKLYRYSERHWLERSLQFGEFRLRPVADDLPGNTPRAAAQILPFAAGAKPAALATYLTLSLAKAWDERLFDEFPGADCCLVIHNAEEFGERIHRAAQQALPNWAGIDAAISYGMPSPLGAAFSKTKLQANQREWLFAWRPIQATMSLNPVTIQIGNIEGIAELLEKKAPKAPLVHSGNSNNL
jgi:hypothetical protein